MTDHHADATLAVPVLRFMDRVGDARHGVALPDTYLRRAEWDATFRASGLAGRRWSGRLGLHPPPFSRMFDRSLPFLAELAPVDGSGP